MSGQNLESGGRTLVDTRSKVNWVWWVREVLGCWVSGAQMKAEVLKFTSLTQPFVSIQTLSEPQLTKVKHYLQFYDGILVDR